MTTEVLGKDATLHRSTSPHIVPLFRPSKRKGLKIISTSFSVRVNSYDKFLLQKLNYIPFIIYTPALLFI